MLTCDDSFGEPEVLIPVAAYIVDVDGIGPTFEYNDQRYHVEKNEIWQLFKEKHSKPIAESKTMLGLADQISNLIAIRDRLGLQIAQLVAT